MMKLDLTEQIFGVEKELTDFIAHKTIFNLHQRLASLLETLEKQHLQQFKNSTIKQTLNSLKKSVENLGKLDQENDEYQGIYLVHLTSLAKQLQELHIYRATEFVHLGKVLCSCIDAYRREHPTNYLKCKITANNSLSYSLTNTFQLFSNGGPFAVSSSSLIDAAVAPFYQEEFKLFNLVKLGYKNTLAKYNQQFNENHLENTNQLDRVIERYRLPRTGANHKEHAINIFEATYTLESNANFAEDTLYVVGFHGNAYTAPAMLCYLDKQAITYFKEKPKVKRLVMIAPDYPGAAASGGKFSSLQELALDSVVLVITHLIKRGVPPSKIIALGHSLGGAVLVTGLHILQKQGIIVTAVSLNSFAQAQKFVADSKVIGALFINHYNDNLTSYFQQLPKHRRHVEHTFDDDVIPLEKSLLKSLGGDEGTIGVTGGHDLDIHNLDTYISYVARCNADYLLENDAMNFKKIHDLFAPIILNQKVARTRFIVTSSYEDTEPDILAQIKNDFTALLKELEGQERPKSKIVLGFIQSQITAIKTHLANNNYSTGFSLFGSSHPIEDALAQLKEGLQKIFQQHANVGDMFLTSEFLVECQQAYQEYKNNAVVESKFE